MKSNVGITPHIWQLAAKPYDARTSLGRDVECSLPTATDGVPLAKHNYITRH
jgi:hypothetical protein